MANIKGTVQRKIRGVQNQSKGIALNMWYWAFISIFFSLHPLISIKQLGSTTAERIGVVYCIGVVLQFSGSTTPVGAIIQYL